MKVIETELKDAYVIEPEVFSDYRGWFMESYSKMKLAEIGINCDFIQNNQSFSARKDTLRGLHFQLNPKSQAKIVRYTRGAILDVAVDIRKGSLMYKKWVIIRGK